MSDCVLLRCFTLQLVHIIFFHILYTLMCMWWTSQQMLVHAHTGYKSPKKSNEMNDLSSSHPFRWLSPLDCQQSGTAFPQINFNMFSIFSQSFIFTLLPCPSKSAKMDPFYCFFSTTCQQDFNLGRKHADFFWCTKILF